MISYNNTYSLTNSFKIIPEEEHYNEKIKTYKSKNYNIESNVNDCIEYINNDNYDTHYEEIKYHIFDDLTHIIKNDNNIELVINISNTVDFLSIVKIKLSTVRVSPIAICGVLGPFFFFVTSVNEHAIIPKVNINKNLLNR